MQGINFDILNVTHLSQFILFVNFEKVLNKGEKIMSLLPMTNNKHSILVTHSLERKG